MRYSSVSHLLRVASAYSTQPNSNTSDSDRAGSSTSSLTAYAMLMQQSFDAAQADTELLGYLPSGDDRPVQVDHRLETLG